jgi:hypothetical protein
MKRRSSSFKTNASRIENVQCRMLCRSVERAYVKLNGREDDP